jgi:hypothetical protein
MFIAVDDEAIICFVKKLKLKYYLLINLSKRRILS